MSTPEAQRRARKAHRDRQTAEGWRQKAFFLAPDTIARLERLAKAGGTSEAATVAHALAKLEEAQQLVPIQVLDVDAEHRLAGPVKPSITASVPLHPSLGKK